MRSRPKGATSTSLWAQRTARSSSQKIKDAFAKIDGVVSVHERQATEKETASFTLVTRGKADPRRALFDVVVDEHLVLLGLEHKQLSLEDTFRKLTTSERSSSARSKAPEAST